MIGCLLLPWWKAPSQYMMTILVQLANLDLAGSTASSPPSLPSQVSGHTEELPNMPLLRRQQDSRVEARSVPMQAPPPMKQKRMFLVSPPSWRQIMGLLPSRHLAFGSVLWMSFWYFSAEAAASNSEKSRRTALIGIDKISITSKSISLNHANSFISLLNSFLKAQNSSVRMAQRELIELSGNINMSEAILVRRRKFAQELRRQEVQAYMRRIRERLLIEAEPIQQDARLTEEELERFRRELEEDKHSTAAVERFLIRLRRYSAESLCTPQTVAAFEVAIMHVLEEGNNASSNAYAHGLAKELLLRIIDCAPNSEGRLPIEFCFKEVLEILSNQSMEMVEVWPAMALVRSEGILDSSFTAFLFYIEQYRDTLAIIPQILESFANFTTTVSGREKLTLSITNLFHVITKLEALFIHFTFADQDLATSIKVLKNLMNLHTFQAIAQLIAASSIFPHLLDLLEDEEVSSASKNGILEFIGLALSGPSHASSKFLRNDQRIIKTLTSFLPGFRTMTPFESFSVAAPQNWPAFPRPVVWNALLCLSNIAAWEGSTKMLLKEKVVEWYAAISGANDLRLHEEVAIFFYNQVAIATDEQVEILLEKGLLQGLNNAIREEFSPSAAFYGVMALERMLKTAQGFPTSNMAWSFSLSSIRHFCHRLGLISYLEGMMVSQNNKLVSSVESCLKMLVQDTNAV